MNVNIEFTGVSRILTGQPGCTLSLAPNASIQDVIIELGKKYPALVGDIIGNDGRSLVATNLFSLNGKKILREGDLQFRPEDGDRLILLSLLAGG